jgi:hypothetical protein
LSIISSSGSSYQPTAPGPSPAASPGIPPGVTRGPRNVALINGVQTFVQATTPNDGNEHMIIVNAAKVVTSLETGGAISANYTTNGVAQAPTIINGGAAAGTSTGGTVATCDPGTVVSVQQAALTGGASSILQAIIEII